MHYELQILLTLDSTFAVIKIAIYVIILNFLNFVKLELMVLIHYVTRTAIIITTLELKQLLSSI